jgi:hypothetical protein
LGGETQPMYPIDGIKKMPLISGKKGNKTKREENKGTNKFSQNSTSRFKLKRMNKSKYNEQR